MNKYKILAIDIGGSHIKGTILDAEGKETETYKSVKTPKHAGPENVLPAIGKLVGDFQDYSFISAGFPGYVKNGTIKTAPNLGTEDWENFPLAEKLTTLLGKPAKVLNDADLQGLGIAQGKGLELVLTLGTGFGTAFLLDGKLLPHFELAHHPFTRKKDYDTYIGEKAFEKIGKKKWNKRLRKVLKVLKKVFNYDYLYIGGGNARHINFELKDNIKIVTNEDGITGGAKIWFHHSPIEELPNEN